MQDSQAVSGSARRSRAFRDFTLTETSYCAGTSLPAHSHENAVLSFAITGGTMISLGGATEWCDTDSLLYLPAGAPHANAYPQAATRLHIEVVPRFWNEAADGQPIPFGGALRHAIAHELHRAVAAAFAGVDNLTAFDVSISLTDTIGLLASSRTATRSMRPDHWLLQLREFLTAHCADPLAMPALTKVTGRHPVHISREFRRHFGKTISEFVRQRRLMHAARLLRDDSLSLAAVALDCGFYDQSHFAKAFRKFAGMAPSAYRASVRRAAASRAGAAPVRCPRL